jgi:putative membrane protein
MYLKKSQIPIFVIFLTFLVIYAVYFYSINNVEFLIYVGVVVFFFLLIISTNRRVKYPNSILWGLMIWAFLHLSGGGIYLGETRLYELMLIPLSENYPIFRFDQLVHMFGFGVTTLLVFHLIKPLLKSELTRWTAISIVVVMAGLGFGALNEIVEFMATVLSPSTGVGGYTNTSLDLVANFIGAILAMVYIRLKHAYQVK